MIFVFDRTKQESFDSLEIWLQEVQQSVSEDVPKVIVGNKSDLSGVRVERDLVIRKAQEYDMTYVETSAKDGFQVDFVFTTLTRAILSKVQKTTVNQPLSVQLLTIFMQKRISDYFQ